MILTSFVAKLEESFKTALPGKEAHKEMSPQRRFPYQKSPNILNCRISAVMILLYERDGVIHLPIIVRPTYDGFHSGQLSLPGGKRELEDTNNQSTALRETEEEIGIKPDEITIIGELTSLYIPKSNFMVYPFVGYTMSTPTFITDNEEVDTLLEIPISLLSDKNKSNFHFKAGDIEIDAPCWKINEHNLWGATAMILAEFKTLISDLTK